MNLSPTRYCPSGDRMLLIEFESCISPAVQALVQSVCRALEEDPIPGVLEWVPSYRSVAVVYDPVTITYQRLQEQVAQRCSKARPHAASGRLVKIPVCYGGERGPDLEWIASYHELSCEEVIRLHSGVEYVVYLLGFTPGFPYLGGLPPELETPRLAEPRPRVKAGTVGIGGRQTGIYTLDGPGAWRLLGATPSRLFDVSSSEPFLLKAGDRVRFVPVSDSEYERLASRPSS
ncbi:MAG: 5-oxoprolinase subunit PxpB [Acidobacteriota bacterium]